MSSSTDDRLIDAAFDVLERVFADRKRLKRLIRRAATRDHRGGSNEADGYPSSSMGGAGGGPRAHVPADEHGPDETIELTATEVAALRRLGETDDELRASVQAVTRTLKTLADSGGRLMALAERIETLNVDPEALNRPKCFLCPKLVLAESELDRHGKTFRTSVDGRTVGLCRWAADNIRARARAIETNKPGFSAAPLRLPTRAEVDQHHAGRNVPVTP